MYYKIISRLYTANSYIFMDTFVLKKPLYPIS